MPDPGDVSALADPSYREWVWWIYRMRAPAEMDRGPGRPRQRVMVDKVNGPLDVLDVRKRFGGGVYEFWGYFDGRLRMRCTHELEGPRVNYEAAAAATAAAPANATPSVPPEIVAILAQQGETLKRLEQAITQRPAQNGMTMRDVLELLPLIQPQQPERQDTSSLFAEMVSAFKTGVELRGTVEGQPEKNLTEVLLEKLVPAAERIVTTIATRRVAARPRAAAAGPAGDGVPTRSGSEASVIDDPPAGSGHAEENHRIMAAIDALARAIGEQDEPGEFAIALERLLAPFELAWIAGKSTDELMAELVPVTRHPIFQSEGARVFVDAMLTELKSPSEPE